MYRLDGHACINVARQCLRDRVRDLVLTRLEPRWAGRQGYDNTTNKATASNPALVDKGTSADKAEGSNHDTLSNSLHPCATSFS